MWLHHFWIWYVYECCSLMECDIVWYLPTRLDDITSQNTIFFMFTAVRTSDLTLWLWLQAKWNSWQGNRFCLATQVAVDLKNKILQVLKVNIKLFQCSDYFVIILCCWNYDCVFTIVKLGCTEWRICSLSWYFLWQRETVWSHNCFMWFSIPFSVPHLVFVTAFEIFPGKNIHAFISGFCKHLLCHLMFNVRIFLCCVNLIVFDMTILKFICLGVIDCTTKTLFCTKMWNALIYMCMCTQ